jgi:hypothetical protein
LSWISRKVVLQHLPNTRSETVNGKGLEKLEHLYNNFNSSEGKEYSYRGQKVDSYKAIMLVASNFRPIYYPQER